MVPKNAIRYFELKWEGLSSETGTSWASLFLGNLVIKNCGNFDVSLSVRFHAGCDIFKLSVLPLNSGYVLSLALAILPARHCMRPIKVVDICQYCLKEVPSGLAKTGSKMLRVVFECQSLQKLSLNHNNLLCLPKEIGRLTRLRELSLVDNELSDLPVEIIKCMNLQVLDLSFNSLTRLPIVLFQMPSLIHLNLCDTSLSYLPSSFGLLTNLRFLDLRENQLRILPDAIGDLKDLKYLDVGKNNLIELPSAIGLLNGIEELHVDGNYLTSLPMELISCKMLQILDISENGIKNLPSNLGELNNLKELLLANNAITKLPSSLECFAVAPNRITVSVSFLGCLVKLKFLSACCNQLAQLPDAIGSCESLVEIRLVKNNLKELPLSIGNLKKLVTLALDENHIIQLPPTIGYCQNLKYLTLRSNDLNELPFEIGRLQNIRIIDVIENKLFFLPYSVSVLSKMRALWLSFTQVILIANQKIMPLPHLISIFKSMLRKFSSFHQVPILLQYFSQKTPLPRLVIAKDSVTHIKVLTCYLLPQGKYQAEAGQPCSKSLHGVSFSDEPEERSSELGLFQRKGTPYPKFRISRNSMRRNCIDGHYISHKKESDLVKKPQKTTDCVKRIDLTDKFTSVDLDLEQKKKNINEKSSMTVLSAVLPTDIKKSTFEEIRQVSRNLESGFGFTIVGGRESKPYKENDTGIFISKIVVGSPAELAGLLPGDKIIFFNGVDVRNEYHDTVAEMMRKVMVLELVVLRQNSPQKQQLSFFLANEEYKNENKTLISKGSPSLEISLLNTQKIVTNWLKIHSNEKLENPGTKFQNNEREEVGTAQKRNKREKPPVPPKPSKIHLSSCYCLMIYRLSVSTDLHTEFYPGNERSRTR
ncbi:unnamed protein product [Thelazia callipaeda]|uniref:PDZ domain-containing protein n=1 Tax=Thelazia callipaeda TaxID=103827 RepID=A0A0N5CXJ1_THECL|nr:unnamed protein product [Thelazia callipaeda]